MLKKLHTIFHMGEKGNIAVFFAILFPVLMTSIIFMENWMEVRYITREVQSILDISTTGAASTGVVYQTNTSRPFCTIPYQDPDNEDGRDVAVQLLRENTKQLPSYVRQPILAQLDTKRIKGLDDREEYAGGRSRMALKFSYQPKVNLFFNKYTIELRSSAECTPDPTANRGGGGKSLSSKEFDQKLKGMKAPSLAELKTLAHQLYGMDEASFNVALGWLAGDNIAEDNYWNYFSACCPINAFVKMGAAGFQSYYCNDAWSGGRGYYTPAAYAGRAAGANENLRRIFYIALTNRDPRPTEANGMAPENGLAGRSISQAIYKTRGYSYELGHEIWWGVWA